MSRSRGVILIFAISFISYAPTNATKIAVTQATDPISASTL
jgi:hypothetical protein